MHPSDWPYERAPLADRLRPTAGGPSPPPATTHGALVIAALGHAGGQGSSAYSQRAAVGAVAGARGQLPRGAEVDGGRRHRRRDRRLRARPPPSPSTPAATASRSTPASTASCASSCPGSPTTAATSGARTALRFARDVLAAVRARRRRRASSACACRATSWRRGPASRPSRRPAIAADAGRRCVDYLVVVRGAIFSVEQTRPDFHQPPMFNLDAVPGRAGGGAGRRRRVPAGLGRRPGRRRVGGRRRRVRRRRDDPRPDRRSRPRGQAGRRRRRAHPAVHPLQPDVPGARRPQPDRDVRRRAVERAREGGPRLVRAGAPAPRAVLVVGGGPAGLETARVAATRGHDVRLVERDDRLGGIAAVAGPGGAAGGVAGGRVRAPRRRRRDSASPTADAAPRRRGRRAVHRLARRAAATTRSTDGAVVLDVARRPRAARPTLPADGADRACSTRSAGRSPSPWPRSSATGPCSSRRTRSPATSWPAPATWRRPTSASQQRGVRIERRSLLRAVRAGEVELEDRFTGARRTVAARRRRRLRLPPARRPAGRRRACGPATASPPARSSRRSSRAAAPRLRVN